MIGFICHNSLQVEGQKLDFIFFCAPFVNIRKVLLFLLSDLKPSPILLILLTFLCFLVWVATEPFQGLLSLPFPTNHTSAKAILFSLIFCL